jgi:hypothetical protein
MCAFMFPLAHTESRPGVLCPPRSGRSESEAPLPVCYTIYLNAHTAQTMQRGRAAARRALRSGARAFYGFGLSIRLLGVGGAKRKAFARCWPEQGNDYSPRPPRHPQRTRAAREQGRGRVRGAERSLRGRRATRSEANAGDPAEGCREKPEGAERGAARDSTADGCAARSGRVQTERSEHLV